MATRGVKKKIESPEVMWQYFLDYKKEVESNPFKVQDFVGKDGEMVYREKNRCLSMIGFWSYLDDKEIISDPSDYFENKEGRYEDFIHICSRIKRQIKRDQIEGGMAGVYNTSITQRLNGLTEKQETVSNNTNLNKIVIEEVQRTPKQIEGTGNHPELG